MDPHAKNSNGRPAASDHLLAGTTRTPTYQTMADKGLYLSEFGMSDATAALHLGTTGKAVDASLVKTYDGCPIAAAASLASLRTISAAGSTSFTTSTDSPAHIAG